MYIIRYPHSLHLMASLGRSSFSTQHSKIVTKTSLPPHTYFMGGTTMLGLAKDWEADPAVAWSGKEEEDGGIFMNKILNKSPFVHLIACKVIYFTFYNRNHYSRWAVMTLPK